MLALSSANYPSSILCSLWHSALLFFQWPISWRPARSSSFNKDFNFILAISVQQKKQYIPLTYWKLATTSLFLLKLWGFLQIAIRAQLSRTNPGLKVNRGFYFSCFKMFFSSGSLLWIVGLPCQNSHAAFPPFLVFSNWLWNIDVGTFHVLGYSGIPCFKILSFCCSVLSFHGIASPVFKGLSPFSDQWRASSLTSRNEIDRFSRMLILSFFCSMPSPTPFAYWSVSVRVVSQNFLTVLERSSENAGSTTLDHLLSFDFTLFFTIQHYTFHSTINLTYNYKNSTFNS